jgi:anti-anti-sigma regulatory factor
MSEEKTTGGSLPVEESGSQMSIPFQIEADMRKGPPSSAVIRLHGDIGDKQNQLLERITDPLLKARIDYAVVDMCDVLSISPGPIKTLVDFAVQRKKNGVKQICALSSMRPAVVKAIRALKPPKVFTPYKELRDATKSLKLRGLPDMYVAGTRPAELNMRVMVKVIPRGARVAVVSPYGYIQQAEAELLAKILRRVSLMQAQNVIIDMSGVSYANSHALGSLLSCASAWEKVYGSKGVALTGMKAGIRLSLTALGASRVAFVCDSVDEALSNLDSSMEEPPPAKAADETTGKKASGKEKDKPSAAGTKSRDKKLRSAELGIDKDADTNTWILKNVQAILRSETKQAETGKADGGGKREGKAGESKKKERERDSSKPKEDTDKTVE